MVTGLWNTHDPNFGSTSWFRRWKEHQCPLSPDLELSRTLEIPDLGLASWSWIGYGHWSLIHPCSKLWLSILILKGQRTSMFSESWFGPDGEGSWLDLISCPWFRFGRWSFIHPFSKFSYLTWFWRCKEHPCPLSSDLGFWRMLQVPDWD